MKKFFNSLLNAFKNTQESKYSVATYYLMADDLISFYAFCSTILAEIAFLWINPTSYTSIFTIILSLFIVNLFVTAFLKMMLSPYYPIVGILNYVILFIVGIKTNLKMGIILMIIPFVYTLFAIYLRGYQDSISLNPHLSIIERFMVMFTKDRICRLISYILSPGAPFILFTCFIIANPALNIIIKIVLVALYILLTPFLAYIEDDWLAQDFYEIFFDWHT